MTIREKYSNYILLFISITMTLNDIIIILAVAIPIINKIFSIKIHAEIPSHIYNISMKYNSELGSYNLFSTLRFYDKKSLKVSINAKEHSGF